MPQIVLYTNEKIDYLKGEVGKSDYLYENKSDSLLHIITKTNSSYVKNLNMEWNMVNISKDYGNKIALYPFDEERYL